MPTDVRRLIQCLRPVCLPAAMAAFSVVVAAPVWGQGLPDLIFADGFEDNCADNPLLGTPCDGPDSDLCAEGAFDCVGGVLECSDTTDSSVDLCNSFDDDCDPASADGSEDPLTGTLCDGPDSDLCVEGSESCFSGGFVCSDNTGSTVDLCNGIDDDCDPASADGSEDPITGSACDGIDSDLCAEGFLICIAPGFVCSDNTGSTVDLCNGINDDCDAASADGSEDPLIGTACDGSDLDVCNEGVVMCSDGAPVCGDSTGDSNRVLDGGFEAGLMGGFWTEFSTNFGSPICSVGFCGGTGGGTGPRTGVFWVWLGGVDASHDTEIAYVNQSLVIPVGTASLTFWLEIPSCNTVGTDTFTVRLDGSTLFSRNNASPACNVIGYVQVVINVSAFANGAAHTLEFRGEFSAWGPSVTNFMIDDVRLEACP